jgi:hypothetical protein
MEEQSVAEYAYDKQGRLRAQWDPDLSGSGTTYAMTPKLWWRSIPRVWSRGCCVTGRRRATRAPAGCWRSRGPGVIKARSGGKAGSGEHGCAHAFSTSPVIGTTLSVVQRELNGVVYSDSWEACPHLRAQRNVHGDRRRRQRQLYARRGRAQGPVTAVMPMGDRV